MRRIKISIPLIAAYTCILSSSVLADPSSKFTREQVNRTIDKVASELKKSPDKANVSEISALYEANSPEGLPLPVQLQKKEVTAEAAARLPAPLAEDEVYQRNVASMFESGASGRVFGIGAVPTRKSEFPECVAVGRAGHYNASGVILKNGIILTAAHICPDDPELVPDLAWLGRVTKNCADAPANGTSIRLSEYLRHPGFKFDGAVGNPLGNDLMLLRIHPDDRSKISLHAEIASEAVAENLGFDPNASVRAVGYGHSRINSQNQLEGFGIRRHISLAVGSKNISGYGLYRTTLGGREVISEFVTGSKIGGDTCKGDSGGPLYVVGGVENGDYLVVGIVSRMTPKAQIICGDGSICTSVPHYTSWIEESALAIDGWKLID